jgi:two-component system, NtrC family, sensor kinase
MKYNIILILLFFASSASYGGNNPYWQEPTKIQADSIKELWLAAENDTVRMFASRQLGIYFQEINRPISLSYFEEQLRLARKLRQKLWEAEALSRIGYMSGFLQNYSGGLKSLLMAMEIASDPKVERGIWNVDLFSKKGDPHHARLTVLNVMNEHIGLLYYHTGDFLTAIEYYKKALAFNQEVKDDAFQSLIYLDTGESYLGLRQFEMAKTAMESSLLYCQKSGYEKYKGLIYYFFGKIEEETLNYSGAKNQYHTSIKTSIQQEGTAYLGKAWQALADLERKTGSIDSSLLFAAKAATTFRIMNDSTGLANAYLALSAAFNVIGLSDSAYYYMKEGITLNSAQQKEERVKKFQAVGFEEQLRLQALEAEQIRLRSNIRTISLLIGMAVLLFISGLIFKNYQQQKKSKSEIEKAYTRLKSTQVQLIHAEKMASLGDLTAGIAHEIQNPLNFVNNFSELSNELIDEMREELASGNIPMANEIAGDIKQNLKKIIHHGKRADAIVKGMLQHSRTSSGQKEPTDINALADEYLRLAFHGLRAKDKSFNADFKTSFDPNLKPINVIPQDIGRVFLNLINNAFFAVNKKAKENINGYKPGVVISTQQQDGIVRISIRDNGTGIPSEIKGKIFQPFFTTKPPGEGTGLGLSLSYDIIKAHGGELKADMTPDGETEFVIQISADQFR